MFSSSSNNMDIPVNIDESESDDIGMEIEDVDSEEEQGPKVQRKKIKKEHGKRGSSSASMPPRPEVSSNKRKSKYWEHFSDTVDEGIVKCKYCSKFIRASSKNGTSALKNYLERCKKYPANLDRKQKLIDFDIRTIVNEDGSVQTVSVPKCWHFDHDISRKALARMVILDELPFMFVEREGFRDFCKTMHPDFVVPSRYTITRDCYGLFVDERKKLKSFFQQLSSRICFTTDTWTSGQNLSYMCLTAHFIDDDWNLHKRIINFCPIAGHSGELIGRAVEKCLLEWDLKKILTITVDNASSNDVAIQYLKRRLNHWGGTILDGNYLHMRCAAHILNLVVKDGLKDLDPSIVKVRAAVRFVRSSPARLQKFKACVEEESIEYKGLVCLDIETRWNSTYLMLDCAWKFRKAFSNMESKGGLYVKELRKYGGSPTEYDWNRIEAFLPFLKIFYETTLKLSGCLYVTGNTYVPQIYGVGYVISTYCDNGNQYISSMANAMKSKYDKYWANVDNINILLFIALVLDPRHKLDYVEWLIRTNYDEERANMLFLKIKVTLKSMFEFYASSLPRPQRKMEGSSCDSAPSASSVPCKEAVMDVNQLLTMKYKKEKGTLEIEKKSELDKYLCDECEHNEDTFDILLFWKDQKKRYPTLTMMARDVLAMPVSTVASESAFSTGGRVLDSFRTSLTPRMVEALICAQDWLRKSHGPLIIEENFLELEALEDSFGDLTLEQPTIAIDESIIASDEMGYDY